MSTLKPTRLMLFISMLAFFWMLVAPFIEKNKAVKVDIIERTSVATTIASIPPKKIEKPLHSVKLPDFSQFTNVAEKKRQFFNFISPAIKNENQKLFLLHEHLLRLQLKFEQGLNLVESTFVTKLARKYRINTKLSIKQQLDELLTCVDQVPEALVLVQAANESAWGTSRFARIGLNFFGIWCYQPKCGMVPNGRSGDDKHEVAAFQSVEQAVQRYFYNINTNAAYKVFRDIRKQLRVENQPLHPKVLASGLLAYSSRGEHYVLEITKMLEQNQVYFSNTLLSE